MDMYTAIQGYLNCIGEMEVTPHIIRQEIVKNCSTLSDTPRHKPPKQPGSRGGIGGSGDLIR